MIEKLGGKQHLVCDICGEETDEKFYSFQEAIDYKKANVWRTKKEYGEWFDVCPDCQDK